MKISRKQLKFLIEGYVGEPVDRDVGREMKNTFRELGGQDPANWSSMRFIKWGSERTLVETLKNMPGEIGTVGHYRDMPVSNTFREHSVLGPRPLMDGGFGEIGLEVGGRVVLASFTDLWSGTSLPSLHGFGDSELADFRKYPSNDQIYDRTPEGGWFGGGYVSLDPGDQIDILRNGSPREKLAVLNDMGVVTSPGEYIEPMTFNEVIISRPVPVNIWVKRGFNLSGNYGIPVRYY